MAQPNKFKILKKINYLFLGLFIVLFIALLLNSASHIRFKTQLNYNEGWNAYHAKQVLMGQNPYQDSWTPLNYPPLSFYLIASLSVFGDPIFVGRVVSLISLMGIIFLVGFIVKTLTDNFYAALFSSFFCLGLFQTSASYYIAMDDPQMLGHLLTISALVIYLLKPFSNYLLISVLCLLGVFTKHNLISLPAALVIDNYLKTHKIFNKLTVYLVSGAVIFFLLIQFLSEGKFASNLFVSRGYSDIWALEDKFINTILYYIFAPLLACLFWLLYNLKEVKVRVICLYFALSFIIGLIFYGGSGVNVNIFFDLLICISIILGIFLTQIEYNRAALLSLVLILTLIFGGISEIYLNNTYNINKREEDTLEDIDFLSKYQGPALCGLLSLCYFSNKPYVYDPFLVREMIVVGKIKEKEVLNLIETKYFDIIQLEFILSDKYFDNSPYVGLVNTGNYTENILKAIGNNYFLVRKSSNGGFYAPKL